MNTNAKTQTASKVGVTTKVADLKKEVPTTATPVKETKAKAETATQKALAPVFTPAPSAENRIKNLENFAILAGRYKSLQKKMTELQKFNLANDGTRIKLIISAGEGVDAFTVSNTEAISLAIEVIKESLQKKTEQAEKEIQEFAI